MPRIPPDFLLEKLLRELFVPNELHSLLKSNRYDAVADSVNPQLAGTEYFAKVVATLRRHLGANKKEIAKFFRLLAHVRHHRASEIETVRRQFGCTEEETSKETRRDSARRVPADCGRVPEQPPGRQQESVIRNSQVLKRALLAGKMASSLSDLQKSTAQILARLFPNKTFSARVNDIPRESAVDAAIHNAITHDDQVALGAVALLLNPKRWGWLPAAYRIVPSWFEGPDDEAFLLHHRRRLEIATANASRGEIAVINVLGTSGCRMQNQLNSLLARATHPDTAKLALEERTFKYIYARILLRPDADLTPQVRRVADADAALRASQVRIAFKRLSPLSGRQAPFHGNSIGTARDLVGERPASPDYHHLYLGFVKPNGTYAGPYIYFDRPLDGDALGKDNKPSVERFQMMFDAFGEWFEHLWQESEEIITVGLVEPRGAP